MDQGLYCETFSNGQVAIGAGDFAFYVRSAWLIEGGRLTRPVKDVNLIGNGPQVLETIEMSECHAECPTSEDNPDCPL